mmetsp:Transcript_20451/g.38286  ORF Transcript_20451/g.38286 Transcript_20451/m.38286 type:complete len:1155 (+) Transcript_20451:87-3551(+)
MIKLLPLFSFVAALKVGLLTRSSMQDQQLTLALSFEVTIMPLYDDWTLEALENWVDEEHIDVLYDYSFLERASYVLKRISESKGLALVVGWSEGTAKRLQTVYSHLTRAEQLTAGLRVLSALKITQVLLLTTDYAAPPQMKEFVDVVASAVVVEDISEASLSKIVKRDLKAEGIRTVVIDLPAKLARKALETFENSNMLKAGYAFIFSSLASLLEFPLTGPLLIIEEGVESAKTHLDYELQSLNWALQKSSFDYINFRESLIQSFAARTFKIINLVEGRRVEVGFISKSEAFLASQVAYPGGLNSFNSSSPITIAVSTLSSDINADGSKDFNNQDLFRGYFAAVKQIESSQLLGRFALIHSQVECGANGYNYEYALKCLEEAQGSLGTVLIGAYSSGNTLGVLEAMKRLNLTQSVIGSQSTSAALSSKSEWPNFVRTIKTTSAVAPGCLQFLKKYQFNRVNLFYSEEPFGQDIAGTMLAVLKANGITVHTLPEDQALSTDFASSPLDFREKGESVIESGVRPTLLLALPNYRNALVDLLYEVGLREKDVLCLNQAQDSSAWTEGTTQQIKKRMSLLANSFFFEQAAFTGPIGEESFSFLKKALDTTPNSGHCQYFDSAYLLAYSLQRMLKAGKDYDDHEALNEQLRDTKFYGCTGRVAIDQDSNDRRDQDIDVFNLKQESSEYAGSLVLKISFTSTKVITEQGEIVWPGGSSTSPSQNRLNYEDCPFPEEYRHNYDRGQELVGILSIAYFTLTLCILAAVLYHQRHSAYPIPPLNDVVQVSFQDRLVLLLVIVDMIQYISHGPVLRNGKDAFENLLSCVFAFNSVTVYYWEGFYWAILNTVFGLIAAWFAFCVLVWLKYKDYIIERFKSLANIAEIAMPILGNAMFMPFISILIDVFVCIEAHGPDADDLEYTDSFMFRDCNEDCWTGSHRNYAIAAGIALTLYLPITAITRPLWQELTPDLHVMTRHNFYIQKSLVEVILVVLRRGLRRTHPLVHSVLYIGGIELHLAFSMLKRPFNYARLNLWFFYSMAIVVWTAIICFVDNHFAPLAKLYSAISTISIAFVLAVAGFTLQRKYFPSYLEAKEDPYLHELFRFAFNLRNVRPPKSLKRSLNFKQLPSAASTMNPLVENVHSNLETDEDLLKEEREVEMTVVK